MPPPFDPASLVGRWMHSDEEDTDAVTVFRPGSFKFPRSRGRTGFELRADQSLVHLGIGPTDRVEEKSGTWKLAGNQLTFYYPPAPAPALTMAIVAHPGRLLIKK